MAISALDNLIRQLKFKTDGAAVFILHRWKPGQREYVADLNQHYKSPAYLFGH
jgi:hypothetical protein